VGVADALRRHQHERYAEGAEAQLAVPTGTRRDYRNVAAKATWEHPIHVLLTMTYSAFTPELLITLPHLVISLSRYFANHAVDSAAGSTPACA
jgi:hypothetical protein